MTMDDFIGDFEILLTRLMDGRSVQVHPSPKKTCRKQWFTNHDDSRIVNREQRRCLPTRSDLLLNEKLSEIRGAKKMSP
jgi:hypothetical protein